MNPNPEPIESPTASPEQRPASPLGLGTLAGDVAHLVQGTGIPEPRNRREARAVLAEASSRGMRKRRQKGQARRLILMGDDAATVLRGDGKVQFHMPRSPVIRRGTSGYWVALFRWILSDQSEDGDDRRQVLMEHFEEGLAKVAQARAAAAAPPEPEAADDADVQG